MSLQTQTTPAGALARRAWARALARRDLDVVIFGGSLLPTVLNPPMLEFRNALRQLPPRRAKVTELQQQPVIVRAYQEGSRTVIAALNAAPWKVDATISLEAPVGCSFTEPGGMPKTVADHGKGVAWSLSLAPYELRIARFSCNGVRPTKVRVTMESAVIDQLVERVEDLKTRVQAAPTQTRSVAGIENLGFEQGSGARLPGWQLYQEQPGTSATRDDDTPHSGNAAVRISSVGPRVTLVSEPFDAPQTGRIDLQAWVRARVDNNQTELRLGIEDADGGPYQMYAQLGGQYPNPLQGRWEHYALPLCDFPLAERPQRLRIRFDLLGPGTVWLDDVRVYDVFFRTHSELNETKELMVMVYQAKNALDEHQYADCINILESYWPRFLMQHVKPPKPGSPPADTLPVAAPPAIEKEPSVADRFRQYIPSWLRR